MADARVSFETSNTKNNPQTKEQMSTTNMKRYLENLGEAVSRQIHNQTEDKDTFSLGKEFKTQTPNQAKFYGELTHLKDDADYADSLFSNKVEYVKVSAKEGVYQFYKNQGLFSPEHHSAAEIDKRKQQLYDAYLQFEAGKIVNSPTPKLSKF